MRYSIYLIMILLLNNCTEFITSDSSPVFKVTYFDYRPASATLYMYTEIENYSNEHSIDSVWAQVFQQNIGEVFSTELTNPYSYDNSQQATQIYSYQGNPGFDSDNYYVKYYFRETGGAITFLTTNIKFLSAYEGDAEPEIINWDIPEYIVIDETEWKTIPIYLTIFDLNGKDDIKSVKYEIKRTFDGCDENIDCTIDPNCNDPINDSNFQTDETWNFEFIEYIADGFEWEGFMFMRPLDGSSFENEEVPQEAADCGRTGEFDIQFIIEDYAGNIEISNEILTIPIIAP